MCNPGNCTRKQLWQLGGKRDRPRRQTYVGRGRSSCIVSPVQCCSYKIFRIVHWKRCYENQDFTVLQSIYLKTGFLTLRTFNFARYPCFVISCFFSLSRSWVTYQQPFLIFPSPDWLTKPRNLICYAIGAYIQKHRLLLVLSFPLTCYGIIS